MSTLVRVICQPLVLFIDFLLCSAEKSSVCFGEFTQIICCLDFYIRYFCLHRLLRHAIINSQFFLFFVFCVLHYRFSLDKLQLVRGLSLPGHFQQPRYADCSCLRCVGNKLARILVTTNTLLERCFQLYLDGRESTTILWLEL